jgi:hypothetical protein
MSSGGVYAQVERKLAADPALRLARAMLTAGRPGVPASVGGPLLDAWSNDAFVELRDRPEFEALVPLYESLGMGVLGRSQPIARALRPTMLQLSALDRAVQPAREAPQPCTQAPAIRGVTTFEGCTRPGSPIQAAAPGTLVRITGSGLSSDPEQLAVRFGESRASILSSGPNEVVVVVPFAGIESSRDELAFTPGKHRLCVSTGRGTASAAFDVLDVPAAVPGSLRRFATSTRRILGHLGARLETQRGFFERTLKSESTGGALALFDEIPTLFGAFAKALDGLPGLLGLLGPRRALADRLMSGALEASGILERLGRLEAALDDPTSALLRGSGVVDELSTFADDVQRVLLITLLVLGVAFVLAQMLVFGALKDGCAESAPMVVGAVIPVMLWVLGVVHTVSLVAITANVIHGVVRVVEGLVEAPGELGDWLA